MFEAEAIFLAMRVVDDMPLWPLNDDDDDLGLIGIWDAGLSTSWQPSDEETL